MIMLKQSDQRLPITFASRLDAGPVDHGFESVPIHLHASDLGHLVAGTLPTFGQRQLLIADRLLLELSDALLANPLRPALNSFARDR